MHHYKQHTVNQIIKIDLPPIFSFNECLYFLDRGYDDCLHQINKNTITKALLFDNYPVLIHLSYEENQLCVEILTGGELQNLTYRLKNYIHGWFDLSRNLDEFYRMAQGDAILSILIKRYYGLRLVGIENLFEALCWAILGQQINLVFAYKTKRALVEKYGKFVAYKQEKYYLFPDPADLLTCQVDDLLRLQISRTKARSILELARLFSLKGYNSTDIIFKNDPQQVKNLLTSWYGVGPWTAQYTMMRCLKQQNAFPVQDVGLQNAVKQILGLADKPSEDQLHALARGWKNWEAYATLYLWRSLAD